MYSSDLDRFEADRPPQPRELVLTEVQRQELRHLLGRIEERCAQLIHEAAGRPAEQEALEKACREDLLRAEQRYLERIAARDR